jgi:hypothetical protein
MPNTSARTTCWDYLGKTAGAFLLLAGLGFLAGCQGLSAAGPAPNASTLSMLSAGLTFGSVAAGSSQTLTLTATNSGSSSITIQSISISTPYFSVVTPSLPATIASGQNATIGVQFAPNAAGAFNATLTINSDAANPVTNVSLSGTGTGTSPLPGQLSLNPNSQNFGSVVVGGSQSQTVTLTNTGGASVNISQVGISGAAFQLSGITTPLTLNASQSTTFTVTFGPQSSGSANGTVTITSNASNSSLTMGLSGTAIAAGALGSNPTSLGFGSVTVGNKQSVSETVTNTGGASVTISQAGTSGSGFSLSGINTPVTLTSGQSTTFSVAFTPASAGSVSGNLTITSNASNSTLLIPLTGTGTSAPAGQLTVNPATLAVGSVVDGTSGTASGSLTASGASVTVTGATSNNSTFIIGGLSLPVTIPAGQSAPFTVTFSPQVSGAASATLTFSSNAQPSTSAGAATGTGTPAPTHTVNLSWSASSSSGVSGYNIYRAVYSSACGSFSKINPTLNTGTLYSDSVVADGSSYCYATTAVDSSNNEESVYSNVVSNIQIPAP